MIHIASTPSSQDQARAQVLDNLFSRAQGGALITSPGDDNTIILLEGAPRKVFILDKQARISTGALFEVEKDGQTEIGLVVKPPAHLSEELQFVEQKFLDGALFRTIQSVTEHPEQCRMISPRELASRYETIRNLQELSKASSNAIPTPFGTLFFKEIEDNNLAGKAKFNVRLCHADMERHRTLISSEWEIKSDDSLATLSGNRSLADFDLICLVALERHKYSTEKRAA